jgi:inner membrane transporter RhtA
MTKSENLSWPLTAVVLAMISFQLGSSIAKKLIPMIGAPGATALRLGLAAIMVAALRRPWRDWPRGVAARQVIAFGLALGTMNLTFYLAIGRIPLGIAVAIEFAGPLVLAVLTSRRAIDYLWIGLAIAGLVPLLPLNITGSTLDPIGVAFALAAGVCWALYIIFGKSAGNMHGASTVTWAIIVASLLVVPIGFADAGMTLFTPAALPYGIFVAIFSSALPYPLEMIGLRRLPVVTYGTLTSLAPALAAFAGWIVLGETLTLAQWIAIGAIVFASIGTTTGATAKSEPLVEPV